MLFIGTQFSILYTSMYSPDFENESLKSPKSETQARALTFENVCQAARRERLALMRKIKHIKEGGKKLGSP